MPPGRQRLAVRQGQDEAPGPPQVTAEHRLAGWACALPRPAAGFSTSSVALPMRCDTSAVDKTRFHALLDLLFKPLDTLPLQAPAADLYRESPCPAFHGFFDLDSSSWLCAARGSAASAAATCWESPEPPRVPPTRVGPLHELPRVCVYPETVSCCHLLH